MKLYVFRAATTCRAVLAYCVHERLDVEIIDVNLMQGEQYEPWFVEINPNSRVPVLVEHDFALSEATAILRYLARKTDSALYPKDAHARARIDELLGWFDSNLKPSLGAQLVYPQVLPHHKRRSDEGNAATIEFAQREARHWLKALDEHYLGGDRTFLVGDQLSIADYFGLAIASLGELVRCTFEDYPNLRRWYRAVSETPAWTSIIGPFKGFAESLSGRELVSL